MILFIIIAGWVWFAWKRGQQDVAWSFPFFMFEWGSLDYMKPIKSKQAHTNGAWAVGIMLVLTSFVYAYPFGGWEILLRFVFALLICWATWWLVFDMSYSKGRHNEYFYIGETADTDIWLRKHLGKDAGRKKAYILMGCIAILITLNLLL